MSKNLSNAKSNTLRLVTASVIAALSFVLMYVGSLSGIFDLCAVTIGAVGTVFSVIELRGPYPWLVAAVVTVLCFLLLPDKFSALEYVWIAGIYPILKAYIERLPKLFSWLIKLAYFNVVLTASIFIAKYLLAITEDWLAPGAVLYLLSNIFFVVFDFALTAFISVYIIRIKPRFKIKF